MGNEPRAGFVGGCWILSWALATVFPLSLVISVRRHQALGVGGPGCAEGWAVAVRAGFRHSIWRGRVGCGQAVGKAWVHQRVWEGLISCPWFFALLGTQMVAVNSSSPTAACSGTWDTRGMEDSVTTSDGNAESLYMQGTGQAAPRALWGRVGRGMVFRKPRPGPGHFSRCCFATPLPLLPPKPSFKGFQPFLEKVSL